MYYGPLYICWVEDRSDEAIIERFKKYGVDGFSKYSWGDECGSCRTRSCPINTGFAEDMMEFCIYIDQNKVISVIHPAK